MPSSGSAVLAIEAELAKISAYLPVRLSTMEVVFMIFKMFYLKRPTNVTKHDLLISSDLGHL